MASKLAAKLTQVPLITLYNYVKMIYQIEKKAKTHFRDIFLPSVTIYVLW